MTFEDALISEDIGPLEKLLMMTSEEASDGMETESASDDDF